CNRSREGFRPSHDFDGPIGLPERFQTAGWMPAEGCPGWHRDTAQRVRPDIETVGGYRSRCLRYGLWNLRYRCRDLWDLDIDRTHQFHIEPALDRQHDVGAAFGSCQELKACRVAGKMS